MTRPVIEATGLVKRYGDHLAVAGVDLHVDAGRILGVLGPNGAGKSTTVRMLTTMTRPDAGTAHVDGIDVVAHPDRVRRRIGVTGQDATLDELLTGRQNLDLVGRLARVDRAAVPGRSAELLDRFELTEAADRPVKTYSGGMRRRLDLAASIVADPPVLFLDEPTTGLDPSSRQRMWDVIRDLVSGGSTLLLTTQYLEEADVLADEIIVIDHGRVIARGTATELKRLVGGERLVIALAAPSPGAIGALAGIAAGPITTTDARTLVVPVVPRPGLATEAVRALDAAGIAADDVETRRPSLDDVFFHLTGAPADAGDPIDDGLPPPGADPATGPAATDNRPLATLEGSTR